MDDWINLPNRGVLVRFGRWDTNKTKNERTDLTCFHERKKMKQVGTRLKKFQTKKKFLAPQGVSHPGKINKYRQLKHNKYKQ